MFVTILRRDRGQNESYEQTFETEYGFEGSILDLLNTLNGRETLIDVNGDTARRICHECSCGTGLCGACALLADGRPVLACETPVVEAVSADGVLRLAPLGAFPVVCDLMVDRDALRAREQELALWLGGPADERAESLFTACLHCGLCAAACPKYGRKHDAPLLFGEAEVMLALDPKGEARRKPLRKALRKALLCPCREAPCERVCPRRLPLRQAIRRVHGLLPF